MVTDYGLDDLRNESLRALEKDDPSQFDRRKCILADLFSISLKINFKYGFERYDVVNCN